jgi:hypothetical protein
MKMQAHKASVRLPERLTGIAPAAKRLGTNHYKVLSLIVSGVLEAEDVDGKPKVRIDSIERYERAQAAS